MTERGRVTMPKWIAAIIALALIPIALKSLFPTYVGDSLARPTCDLNETSAKIWFWDHVPSFSTDGAYLRGKAEGLHRAHQNPSYRAMCERLRHAQ